jgi:hypothetical protein
MSSGFYALLKMDMCLPAGMTLYLFSHEMLLIWKKTKGVLVCSLGKSHSMHIDGDERSQKGLLS